VLLQFHMHHKFAIVDGRLLINGSFNWTRQAVLYNQENCVVTDNGSLVSSVRFLGCPGIVSRVWLLAAAVA